MPSGYSNTRLQLSNFQWGDVQVGNLHLQRDQNSGQTWVLEISEVIYQSIALGNIRLHCRDGGLSSQHASASSQHGEASSFWACNDGQWQWQLNQAATLLNQPVATSHVLSYEGQFMTAPNESQWLSINADGFSLSVADSGDALRWDLKLAINDLTKLIDWWPKSFAIQPLVWRGAMKLTAQGGLQQAALTLQLDQMDFDSQDGRVATGALDLELNADIRSKDGFWQWQSHGHLGDGALLWDQWFIDFTDRIAKFEINVGAQPEHERWYIEHFSWRDPPALELVGHGAWGDGSLQALKVEQLALDLSVLSPAYLSGWLAGLALTDLGLQGQLSGQAEFSSQHAQADLSLVDVHVIDGRSRFVLEGLNGHLQIQDAVASSAPQSDQAPELQSAGLQTILSAPSMISWDRFSVWGLESQASELKGQLTKQAFNLLEPTRLPILDGALRLDQLAVQYRGENNWVLALDAEIEPIDMGLLTQAFGWPAFGGTLAGRLPGAQLENGVLSLDGALDFEIFSGRVRLQSLALERTFGTLPSLSADLSLEGLELESLTQAFSFGRITGQLNGEVNQLRLLNWQPVAFDARIYSTTKGRISQRAVDNLSRIGGGGGAALGGIVGALFDDFPYRKLGLACRLENNICHMDGVEAIPSENAYYIVRGRGLPRITIKGFQRQVDWPVLLNQLKQIVAGPGSPEIR